MLAPSTVLQNPIGRFVAFLQSKGICRLPKSVLIANENRVEQSLIASLGLRFRWLGLSLKI